MSLHDPVIIAQEIGVLLSTVPADAAPPLGDRLHRLLEAGRPDCCTEGDLLALMPSVDDPDRAWSDDRTWLRRVLGF